jgi:hypothetical protein
MPAPMSATKKKGLRLLWSHIACLTRGPTPYGEHHIWRVTPYVAAPGKCEAERFASTAQEWPLNLLTWPAVLPRTLRILLVGVAVARFHPHPDPLASRGEGIEVIVSRAVKKPPLMSHRGGETALRQTGETPGVPVRYTPQMRPSLWADGRRY